MTTLRVMSPTGWQFVRLTDRGVSYLFCVFA
jgi:hypothetical protein